MAEHYVMNDNDWVPLPGGFERSMSCVKDQPPESGNGPLLVKELTARYLKAHMPEEDDVPADEEDDLPDNLAEIGVHGNCRKAGCFKLNRILNIGARCSLPADHVPE